MLAEIALQFPSCLGNSIYAIDRFHVHWIAHPSLRDPHGTEEMGPFAVSSLLERTALIGAKQTADSSIWGDGAFATEPLSLGDVGYAVAVLVNREVAAVTEDDCVGVLAFAIIADGAFCVLALRNWLAIRSHGCGLRFRWNALHLNQRDKVHKAMRRLEQDSNDGEN